MLYHGSQAGAFDLKTVVLESVTSMKRAGVCVCVCVWVGVFCSTFPLYSFYRCRYNHLILHTKYSRLVERIKE